MKFLLRAICAAALLQLSVIAALAVYPNAVLAIEADFDVATAINTAVTKADHEKIEAFYEQQAKDLDAKVAQHQRMKNAYQHAGHLRQLGVRMRAHCDKLIKNYQIAAAENRQMAKSHHTMADKCPQ